MKRDMDIIRTILISEETGKPELLEQFDHNLVAYNVQLMIDHGLLEARVAPDYDGDYERDRDWHIFRITWDGHDFLSAIRDETLWAKAREKLLKPAASWSFAVLMEWLKRQALEQHFPSP